MDKRHQVAAAIRLLLWASCAFTTALVSTSPTEAQAPDARSPVLALSVEPGVVPTDALRGALESELGVRILPASVAPASLPVLSVRKLPTGNVEVALVARLVPRASREVQVTAERESEQVETIALIASNLVRNEAASLLPDLQPIDGPPPPPPPPAAQVPEPPAPKEVKLVSPCDDRSPREFGFDFAPGVGSSSSPHGRDAVRSFSLGFVGTLSKGLRGFELSVGANIKTLSVCGAQVAVGANVAWGALQGAQVALFNMAREGLQGAQVGLVNVTGGAQRGVQAGLINMSLGSVHGAKGSLVNFTQGDGTGFRGALVNLDLGTFQGFQGGVVNVVGKNFVGFQGGVANFAAANVRGFQGSVANITVGETVGLQAGVANVSAGEVKGLQLGVVNYADKADASIGLVSIVRRGRTSFDALSSIDDGVTMMAAVTHGGKYVHNTYGIGGRLGADTNRAVAMLGIGVRVLHTARLRIDIDAIAVHDIGSDELRMSSGLRVPVTIPLVGGLGVLVAPSYNVYVSDDLTAKTKHWLGDTTFRGADKGDTVVIGYPSITAGLRWEFDHGA